MNRKEKKNGRTKIKMALGQESPTSLAHWRCCPARQCCWVGNSQTGGGRKVRYRKGTLTRDFRPLCFSSNNFLWVPDTQHRLKPFRVWLRIRKENRQSWLHSGVIDTAVQPTFFFSRISSRIIWHTFFYKEICLDCKWHSGVIALLWHVQRWK
jgi:hypothetical protein